MKKSFITSGPGKQAYVLRHGLSHWSLHSERKKTYSWVISVEPSHAFHHPSKVRLLIILSRYLSQKNEISLNKWRVTEPRMKNYFYFRKSFDRVWDVPLGSSLRKYESAHDKTYKIACAPSEDSDQPGHPPSLIRVFAVCMKKAWVISYPLSAQQRLIRCQPSCHWKIDKATSAFMFSGTAGPLCWSEIGVCFVTNNVQQWNWLQMICRIHC